MKKSSPAGQDEELENAPIRLEDGPPANTIPARLAVVAQKLQQLFDERAKDPAGRHRGAGKLRH